MLGLSPTRPMNKSLRVLAGLLTYPDAGMREQLPDMWQALVDEDVIDRLRQIELKALMDALAATAALDGEADYVELFDRGRATSLHLFEHVHGDSRDRGPAMVDLCGTYEKAGLFLAPGELPDYLPTVLEFASTQPPPEARAFLGEIVHILNAIFGALSKRRSAYASVIGALIELSGEKAQPVEPAADEPLDETWAEPPVFDGCSSKGQAKPGQPQPIRVTLPGRAASVDAKPRAGAST